MPFLPRARLQPPTLAELRDLTLDGQPCLATATRHVVRLPDPILVGITWIGFAIARPPRTIPLELHVRSFMMPSS
jgi:hypothetical protein